MRPQQTERAYGPYKHRNRWRVVVIRADGGRVTGSYKSLAAAEKAIADVLAKADGRTVSAAVDLYVQHLRDRGRADTTAETVAYRLRGLLRTFDRDRLLHQLTVPVARALFDQRAADTAPETQRGELATASAFATWCLERGWMRANPFTELEPTGPRSRGKPQLRIDEARLFVTACLDEGTPAGLASALALLCAMRATEITARVVRDVDDGARVLWIERAKTRAGDRRLEVPEVLRPPLAALVAGRAGGEPLFGDVDRHWLGYHVRRLCKRAGVPVVCPHGLRGTHASLAVPEAPVEHVARALGHTGAAITRQHYLVAGAEQLGTQRAALRVLAGGRRP